MTQGSRLLATLVVGVGVAASAIPAQASAGSISSQVRLVYEQRGEIPPCRFTSPQLTTAENAVDAYDLEYFADYIAAIQSALTLRAAGACSRNAAPAGPAALNSSPPSAALPASLTSPTRSGAPAPLVVLIILGLVLAGVAAVVTLGRRGDSPSGGTGPWSHGAAEARYRAEGLWYSVMDRLRR